MITADGMKPSEVRCDRCGVTQRCGASCNPGLPCGLRRNMTSPRCPGTWRTREQLEAMARAVAPDPEVAAIVADVERVTPEDPTEDQP